MSLTPRYLVNNRTTLAVNVAGFVTEYRPVYQKDISIYKGIDNTLEFQLKNPDQKPISLENKTCHFVAFDENNKMVLDLLGENLIINKGLFKVVIRESEILNLKSQYLSYNVYITDSTTNSKILTYADEQLNSSGTLYISAEAFPGPSETYEVKTFNSISQDSSEYISEYISAEPAINGNEGLHTAVIYSDNYIGDITVQGTLENQIDSNTTEWFDIETIFFSGNETAPVPVNFYGVYSYLRFATSDIPTDKITKILVRN